MNAYVARSRVTKALTDGHLASSFAAAEARLDSVHVCVIVGPKAVTSRAGQTAALTALATTMKCFGSAELVCAASDFPLLAPMPLGATIGEAARALGVKVSTAIPADTTHLTRAAQPCGPRSGDGGNDFVGACPRQNGGALSSLTRTQRRHHHRPVRERDLSTFVGCTRFAAGPFPACNAQPPWQDRRRRGPTAKL